MQFIICIKNIGLYYKDVTKMFIKSKTTTHSHIEYYSEILKNLSHLLILYSLNRKLLHFNTPT